MKSVSRALPFATVLLFTQLTSAQTFKIYEPTASSHVIAPARATNVAVPTLVFLHGGAWVGGDFSHYETGARSFNSKGIRVVPANYRLAQQSKHPAPIDDLDAILRKLPANHSRIFLSGHSAGAHLIAFWNASQTDKRVRGFIGIEGIYDIPKLVKKWPSYRGSFISAELGSDSAKWPSASPSLLPARAITPWLVDFAQTTDFEKHLSAQKIPVELLTLKNESYFGAVEALSHADSPVFQKALSFITKAD